MGMQISLRDPDFNSFGYQPTNGIAGSYCNSVFNFLKNPQTFPQQLYHFIFPPVMHKCSDIIANICTLCFLFGFVFLPFLGPLLWHMEIPRLGVRSELQPPACDRATAMRDPLRLQPTPQLMATPDPQPSEQGQGLNRKPHGSQSDSSTTEPRRELRC